MNLVVTHGFEANYVVGFARGLAANGVPFTVLSSDETAPRYEAAGIPHWNIRGSQDPARPSWEKALNIFRYYVLLLWAVVRHRGKTLHFNGLLSSRSILLDGIFLPIWFRVWSGRYLHTAHNALPHSRERSRLFRIAYRFIYRFPHTIIAHTEKVAQQLEHEFKVKRSRIEVISIGLNEEMPLLQLTAAEARTQLGLPQDKPVALFFGKIESYKGVDMLAEAWSFVKTPAHLSVVGWCPDSEYANRVRTAIQNSPRTESIEWREGFVPNEQVPVWLRACDVVVMPYRNIYQSGVVFLCMRFGVPIVATNVGSLPEYITKDSGVIAETNDAPGFAAALDSFFVDRNLFDRAAIANAASKYSWDRQCAAIRHLYL